MVVLLLLIYCLLFIVAPIVCGVFCNLVFVGFQDQLLLNAGQKYCRMLQDLTAMEDSFSNTNSPIIYLT